MRIVVKRSELLTALDWCAPIAGAKNQIPILSCVLLEASDGKLVVRATNAVSGVERESACQVDRTGSTALPCAKLHALVGAMPEGDIGLLLKDQTAELRCHGSRRYKLAGLPASDYPARRNASGDDIVWTSIQAGAAAEAIKRVRHCVSTERSYMNGVLLALGEQPAAVGMHSHRAAVAGPGAHDPMLPNAPGVFVPAIVLLPLLAICEAHQEIRIGHNSREFYAAAPGALIHAALPEAPYPPWQMLFVAPGERAWTVDAALCAETLRAITVADDEKAPVKLAFEDGSLRITLQARQQHGADQIQAEGNQPFAFHIDAGYLSEAIRHSGTTVRIGQASETDPVSIVGENFRATIMPRQPGSER